MRITRALMIATLLAALAPPGCDRAQQSSEQPQSPPRGAQAVMQAPVDPETEPATPALEPATAEPEARPSITPVRPGPTILLSQAQFAYVQDPKTGKQRPKPLPARMVILQNDGQHWQRQVFEDPESNVFHKAVLYADPADPAAVKGIMTAGANAAAIKLWRQTDEGWKAETLWQASFGGKWDRMRDFEIGDVTGDGKPDIAVVTHDQGVVVVLKRTANGWEVIELDRQPNTFVHEVELADLDGDGLLEIYATPSQPNRFDGSPQPGEITCYYHTNEGFKRRLVERFELRHVKEILATDADGSGRPVLLAAVEAELGKQLSDSPDATLTLIKRYRFENGGYVGEVVCTLPDKLCRFLNIGDVDGDGKADLVASMHKAGIWIARPGPTPWPTEQIDADSGGFEHATVMADLDADGVHEIYVAADKQQSVRQYRWDGSKLARTTLYEMEDDKLTFHINADVW